MISGAEFISLALDQVPYQIRICREKSRNVVTLWLVFIYCRKINFIMLRKCKNSNLKASLIPEHSVGLKLCDLIVSYKSLCRGHVTVYIHLREEETHLFIL